MPAPPVTGLDRRLFLTSLLGVTAAAAGLSGCAEAGAAADEAALKAPRPGRSRPAPG